MERSVADLSMERQILPEILKTTEACRRRSLGQWAEQTYQIGQH